MQTSIIIRRDKVFATASRRMAWVGTRGREESPDYERVVPDEADHALLHTFFDDAAMRVIDLCRPFLERVSNTDEALTLRLARGAGPDEEQLCNALEQMLEAYLLGEWQEIVCPQRAATAFARSDEAAAKAAAILYHHRAPVRAQ